MSALTVAGAISFGAHPLTKQHVKQTFVQSLKKDFGKFRIKQKHGEDFLRCRIKTKMLNPIVSVSGPLKIQARDQKPKYSLMVPQKPTDGFLAYRYCRFILTCCGRGRNRAVNNDVFMYLSQKTAEAFSNVMKQNKVRA